MTSFSPFAEENIRWFFVLLAAIAGAVLGTLLPKAVGVTITAKLKIEVWNECLVVHQFAYLGYYTSLLTAFDLRGVFRDVYVFAILITFIFFAAGLYNLKTGQAASSSIIKGNVVLAAISFVATVMLIGSLQYACMLDLWLTVSTLVSKTVLSFWSPHLLLTTRMNAWAESSPYPASASARWTPT